MKLKPLHDRILVERVDPETVSAGGILIPDQAAERPTQGIVIAVGKGRVMDDGSVRPVDLKPGDRILFGKYTGSEAKFEGKDFVVMREEDVMAQIG